MSDKGAASTALNRNYRFHLFNTDKELKDAKEEAMDFVVYLTKLEKLLTGDNTSDKLLYDSEKIRK